MSLLDLFRREEKPEYFTIDQLVAVGAKPLDRSRDVMVIEDDKGLVIAGYSRVPKTTNPEFQAYIGKYRRYF